MAVDAKFRRLGIAKALMQACEDAARGYGCGTVSLHVRPHEAAAVALYRSSGFVALGTDSWMDTVRYRMKPRTLMQRRLQ
ncbi:MAG: hypothetical protein WDW36_008973 [Sanguina aurantia]